MNSKVLTRKKNQREQPLEGVWKCGNRWFLMYFLFGNVLK
jgi:hypothetical protein